MDLLKFMLPKLYFGVVEGAGGGAGSTGAAGQAGTGAQGAADHKGAEGDDKLVPIKAVHEERTKRQTLEAKLKQMEAVFGDQIAYDSQGNLIPKAGGYQPAGQGTGAAVAAPQSQPGNWEDYRKQLDDLWENNPRAAMQTELSTAIGWYDQVNTQVEEQMDQLAEKVKDFNQYRPRIRQYLRRLPLDQRSRPGIVEAAYYLQKGQSIDQIIEAERKALAEKFGQVEGIQGIPGGSGSAPAGDGGARRYSAEEVQVAKMYGMTPEQYFGGKG